MTQSILVTGAAGFIGCNLIRHLRNRWPDRHLISFDALTYSGNLENLASLRDDPKHTFVKGDITDRDQVRAVFDDFDIVGVIHLAAESHVDRSIVEPLAFVQTNIDGTAILLQEATRSWKENPSPDNRFHHVSTDEVFGSLGHEGYFDESTPYAPRSPYSASKAASDHLVRAWFATYKLPVVITNCSNNYGPNQFPEKLIPLTITRALAGQPIPIYGTGENVRDWLYVEDHCNAIAKVYEAGTIGDTYCVGGLESEVSNIDLVRQLLDVLDVNQGKPKGTSQALITFVKDRPGHDFRYAIDFSKLRDELGWTPTVGLESGLEQTVAWYTANEAWCASVQSGAYRDFETAWYAERGGTKAP